MPPSTNEDYGGRFAIVGNHVRDLSRECIADVHVSVQLRTRARSSLILRIAMSRTNHGQKSACPPYRMTTEKRRQTVVRRHGFYPAATAAILAGRSGLCGGMDLSGGYPGGSTGTLLKSANLPVSISRDPGRVDQVANLRLAPGRDEVRKFADLQPRSWRVDGSANLPTLLAASPVRAVLDSAHKGQVFPHNDGLSSAATAQDGMKPNG
jgi:hypothetical protein